MPGPDFETYVIASALGVKMAVPLSQLAEIVRMPATPGSRMLFRGRTIELADAADSPDGSARRVLVLKDDSVPGILVSGVLGLREIRGSEIRPVAATPLAAAVPAGVIGVTVSVGEVVYVVDAAEFSAGAGRRRSEKE